MCNDGMAGRATTLTIAVRNYMTTNLCRLTYDFHTHTSTLWANTTCIDFTNLPSNTSTKSSNPHSTKRPLMTTSIFDLKRVSKVTPRGNEMPFSVLKLHIDVSIPFRLAQRRGSIRTSDGQKPKAYRVLTQLCVIFNLLYVGTILNKYDVLWNFKFYPILSNKYTFYLPNSFTQQIFTLIF